ncbi:hypothetical protein KV697_19830 (plasmid) [Sphingomonas sanguinis]|uniref:hypothetical protein n=1 Tax=Sphingomonas sanguinis TaxID=33051 RepID=UPI001C56576A|nr:hypothetical protein [Sphingomonas sanguinis]QXT37991.1 hypothetical protein KV697_19830 [Sphingomonas sanguinis]
MATKRSAGRWRMFKRPSTGLRNLTIIVTCLAFVVFVFLAQTVLAAILPSQGNDAETVAKMSSMTASAETFDGYAAVSLIYAHTNEAIRLAMLIVFGVVTIGLLLWWLRMPRTLILALACLVPAWLLYLPLFTKDTFVTPVIIGSTLILTSLQRRPIIRIGLTGVLYLLYAVIFRQYFIIIFAVWLGLLLLLKVDWRWRIVILAVVPLAAMLIPDSLYETLQMQRDIVNYTRLGGQGNRTAFMNLVQPDGLRTFPVNYFYAAWRLNFPIFVGGGPKEAYLFVMLGVYVLLMIRGLRSGNSRVSWPAALFCAHMLVLNIFEPDLGSYLRHLSTALLFLAPSLAMWDRLWQASLMSTPGGGGMPATSRPERPSRAGRIGTVHGTF